MDFCNLKSKQYSTKLCSGVTESCWTIKLSIGLGGVEAGANGFGGLENEVDRGCRYAHVQVVREEET